MSFVDSLREQAVSNNSIVCMGLDPQLEKIPIKKGGTEKRISNFYFEILDAIVSSDSKPAIVKPNYAFFAQYGFEGLRALKSVMSAYQDEGIPILLDAKRGDIGKTSIAYAKEIFDFWNADAVTVNAYLGEDSMRPFLDWVSKGKGVYVLVRTSNPSAVDIQNLKVDGVPIYMKMAEKVVDWHRPGLGVVIGATYPDELEEISKYFVESGKEIPMLIPGVGAQGGSAIEVVNALKKTGNDLRIHRINSSSGINYAYEKLKTDDYAGAAVKAIKELNKAIGKNTNFK